MSSAAQQQASVLKGGEWLIKESTPFETFIPEDFKEEQQMVKEMCASFLDTEVLPVIDRIDKMEPGLMPSLLEKPVNRVYWVHPVPEELGGLGKDFITSTLVNEGLGGGFLFFSCNSRTYRYWHIAHLIFWNGSAERKIYPQTGQR